MHLRTKFEFDKSKFAWDLRASFSKILKKFKIWKNLNALIDFGQIQYQSSLINIIYLCVVLRRGSTSNKITWVQKRQHHRAHESARELSVKNLELYHAHLKKKLKFHKITNLASIIIKIVTTKGLWLLHWCIKFHIDISSHFCVGFENVKNRTHTHIHTYIRTAAKNHVSQCFRLFWVL